MGTDELFAELRVLNVSHLGQIEYAILEANGKISLFYHTDDKLVPGLPILPDQLAEVYENIATAAIYSFAKCGFTKEFNSQAECICNVCESNQWVLSKSNRRLI